MQLVSEHSDGSYRACSALVVGDVTIGRQSSFWFQTVVRGDVAPIRIGQRVNLQDAAVIHVDAGVPNVIEDEVTIGHGAVLHGEFVGRGTLIGMRATLLGHSRIGSECLVAAGAVVPPGLVVPDRHMVAGVPARIIRPVKEEEIQYIRYTIGRYVELAQEYAAGKWTVKP